MNAIEDIIVWSDTIRRLWGMERGIVLERVREILQVLNREGIRYAVGGALALAWWVKEARATKDIDIFVFEEDIPRVIELFREYYKGGSGVVHRFEIEGMPVDIIRARAKFERDVVRDAKEVEIFGVKARVINLKNYITTKLISAFERLDPSKAHMDRADLLRIIRDNSEKLTWDDILYVIERIAVTAYIPGKGEKFLERCRFLADALRKAGREDLAKKVEDFVEGTQR